MRERGVKFQDSPETYYEQLADIQEALVGQADQQRTSMEPPA